MISKSERAQLYKIKKHKDLGFLLELKQEKPVDNIRKYILKQGTGSLINEIKIPLSVNYSYEKYDYSGKLVIRVENKNCSLPFVPKQKEYEENNLCTAVQSMRLNERSWFNVQLFEKEATTCGGYNGYHYEITLEKFTYKNDNNYESKKIIYEENRQNAKKLFQKQNYKQALKIYKHSINILSGLSKKFFKIQELKELQEYCEKSETNFLKCLAKLNGFGGRYDKDIGKMAKQLTDKFIRKYPDSLNSLYQKAIYLKYESKFSDAEDAVKEAMKKKFSEDPETAKMEKNALVHMHEQIKKAKERNVRHLRRQQIRKKKAEKRNADIWDSLDEDQAIKE